jgi:ligand-binding SRPBCC domain-containing protein
MKVRSIERTQIVRRPIAETFAFFCDPRNLERLTPAFLRFQFLREPPATMAPGTVLDYRIRLYGVPVHWRTRIEIVEPPVRFVDVEETGPYAYWQHTHTFTDLGEALTDMRDHVEFAMPLGPLGEIAYRLFVARSLKEIFDYRERALTAILAAERR